MDLNTATNVIDITVGLLGLIASGEFRRFAKARLTELRKRARRYLRH